MSPTERSTLDESMIFRITQLYLDISKMPQEHEIFVADRFTEEIAKRIARDEPLRFMLPAFPAKSPNTTKKVLGTRPDRAERVSIDTLGTFCNEIGEIYRPGASLTICADGRVFADIVQVSDKTVDQYAEEVRDMARSYPIDWFALDTAYPGLSCDGMRASLMSDFGSDIDLIHARAKVEQDFLRLYMGMTRFMKEDRTWPPELSRSKQENLSKEAAIAMLARNEAYSGLLTQTFPDRIRLSVHGYTNGKKFGVSLVPGVEVGGTPWHNSLVAFDDLSFGLMHRAAAEAKGFDLVHEDGRPSYFAGRKDAPTDRPPMRQ